MTMRMAIPLDQSRYFNGHVEVVEVQVFEDCSYSANEGVRGPIGRGYQSCLRFGEIRHS